MDTKICKGPTCRDESGNGKEKPVSEFCKDRIREDGLSPYCKECRSYYHRKRYRSPGVSQARIAYNREYFRTEAGKKSRKRSYLNCVEKYPNKRKARAAVNNAIYRGELLRANENQCSYPGCKKQARQYHHHSYKPEHWLDVTPYCIKHHTLIDQLMDAESG